MSRATQDLQMDCKYIDTSNGVFYECTCFRSSRRGTLSLFNRCTLCKQYEPLEPIKEVCEIKQLTIEELREQFENEMRKLNYDVSLCKNGVGDFYLLVKDKLQIYEVCARANNLIKE